jgi:hypothetical protein
VPRFPHAPHPVIAQSETNICGISVQRDKRQLNRNWIDRRR